MLDFVKKYLVLLLLFCSVNLFAQITVDSAQYIDSIRIEESDTVLEIRKVLFIGDSMTGWLSERFAAYGIENDFEVATVVWDGSTIKKWANSNKLSNIIKQTSPNVIFVCLGLNELFEKNPESNLSKSIKKILTAFGDIPYLWIGPPSWPGKGKGDVLNEWLKNNLKKNSYFYSGDLDLARQSTSNPHPTKNGVIQWMDTIVEWLPMSNLCFKSLDKPTDKQMVRGKWFIYRRMNEML